ncbi:NAD(P)H-hydrate dehydratase [Curvibacter sp. CHRR-16]|uniref:NAD(P)H-hydrate dehydratase n=1 Tax=Curvibacter sp. CHRR-16 TaxID=2835872 RepID=UPI001BDA2E64|nr:NAD(P)H-hydrate dehydratase [Curvibacter sp. CHRR-16]MBT0569479.1 NAD(P)H-hydrate dehydratase [Curvibacter sp. CHRR-16]
MTDFLTPAMLRAWLPQRPADSHKGMFGSVLTVGGSQHYRGAPLLAALASLRVGAGYATLAAIETVVQAAMAQTPALIAWELPERDGCIASDAGQRIVAALPRYQVLCMGCGLGNMDGVSTEVQVFTRQVLQVASGNGMVMVVDADALNVLAQLPQKQRPRFAAQNTVLTPHPQELARLLQVSVEEVQANRAQYVAMAARQWQAVVILKGHQTLISDGEQTFTNPTGNSALAKAGTGDVLAGMVAGLCAQGAGALQAACVATYLHGLAGQLCSQSLTTYSMLPTDLLTSIPYAVAALLEP